MTYIPDSLREFVKTRAVFRCEYCLIPERAKFFTFEIDHIIPVKHRGLTHEDNLCLSCLDCNRFKGSDIASLDLETGALARLYNPRRDRWGDHFQLDGAYIRPLTPEGRVTSFVLRFNDPPRLEERMMLINAHLYPPIPE